MLQSLPNNNPHHFVSNYCIFDVGDCGHGRAFRMQLLQITRQKLLLKFDLFYKIRRNATYYDNHICVVIGFELGHCCYHICHTIGSCVAFHHFYDPTRHILVGPKKMSDK